MFFFTQFVPLISILVPKLMEEQKKLRSFDMEKNCIVFYCLFWYICYIKTKLNTYPCIQMSLNVQKKNQNVASNTRYKRFYVPWAVNGS